MLTDLVHTRINNYLTILTSNDVRNQFDQREQRVMLDYVVNNIKNEVKELIDNKEKMDPYSTSK